MNFKSFAIDFGKGVVSSAITGIGLQVGRDLYVYVKESVLGKREQPTLVRFADPVVPGVPGACCDRR